MLLLGCARDYYNFFTRFVYLAWGFLTEASGFHSERSFIPEYPMHPSFCTGISAGTSSTIVRRKKHVVLLNIGGYISIFYFCVSLKIILCNSLRTAFHYFKREFCICQHIQFENIFNPYSKAKCCPFKNIFSIDLLNW